MTDTITVGSIEYKRLLHRAIELETTGDSIGLTAREYSELSNIRRKLERAELAHAKAREAVVYP